MDFSTYDDQALDQLRADVYQEIVRRSTVANASNEVDSLIAAYSTATGRVDGSAWVQPTSAIDAYPLGATVTDNSITYESLIPANTTTPGDPNDGGRWWKDASTIPVAGAWDGNSHVYAVGDKVTYNGHNYTCLQAHTSQPGWTPSAVPSLWTDNGPTP